MYKVFAKKLKRGDMFSEPHMDSVVCIVTKNPSEKYYEGKALEGKALECISVKGEDYIMSYGWVYKLNKNEADLYLLTS
jgi:hypothetical protein